MHYVIIGSSAAGINATRELRILDKDSKITLISKDNEIYSRCILHHYLSGTRNVEQLNFAENDFFTKYNVEFLNNTTVLDVDVDNKVITTNTKEVSYDKLLIASGGSSFMPPIKNIDQCNDVIGFRNLDDIETIKNTVTNKKAIVVLGAGLVGIDCVVGLLHTGHTPTIVDVEPHVLSKQLDPKSADAYQDKLVAAGVDLHFGKFVSSLVVEDGNLQALKLQDGTMIPCDYLIVATGIKANVDFLKNTKVLVEKHGLVFDEFGQTNCKDIYGAGDVSGLSPIWPLAVKQGIIAANNMFGNKKQITDFFASKSTMNFFDIPTISLGDVNYVEGLQVDILEDETSYKKIISKDGKIVSALLQGDLAYSGILQQLIINKIDIRHIKKPIFEIDYSDFFNIDEHFEYYY